MCVFAAFRGHGAPGAPKAVQFVMLASSLTEPCRQQGMCLCDSILYGPPISTRIVERAAHCHVTAANPPIAP